MTAYRALTPTLRRKILTAFDDELRELNQCEDNVLVRIAKESYKAQRDLISRLPDGYPMPMSE